jgi:hypothetical protein
MAVISRYRVHNNKAVTRCCIGNLPALWMVTGNRHMVLTGNPWRYLVVTARGRIFSESEHHGALDDDRVSNL